ncbi:MAG TPA: tetratricopeptide repeat protein [candidate division Zixibacteria bacterium]|nr:tetratricopeptide repeat protein [candidate division Zixibacteria bacterium]
MVEGFCAMKIFGFIITVLVLFSADLRADDVKSLNDKGVQAYQQQRYDSSLHYFREAQDLEPENKIVDFNLGNALHQQGQYEDAVRNYERAISQEDSALAAEAYYNIGNTNFRAGQLDKAIRAYKKSLDYNPDDKDTKYNLELALKAKQEQQQKQQNQDQKQDQEDKEEQDDQEQQDQQKQDQQQDQDEQQQDQQEQQKDEQQDQQQEQEQEQDQNQQQEQGEQPEDQQEQQNQQQPSEQRPMQLDEERAQALLEGLNQDEKEVLKQLIKQKVGVSSYNGKDW